MSFLGTLVSERTFLGIRENWFMEHLPREEIYAHTDSPNSDHINYPHYWKGKGPKYVTIPKSLKIETIKNGEKGK